MHYIVRFKKDQVSGPAQPPWFEIQVRTIAEELWSARDSLFERLRYRYLGLLDFSLRHRAPVLIVFLAVSFGSLWLVRLVGRDFFPEVED